VTATVVLVTLLLAPGASGSAAPAAACKTYARGSETLPALVSEWFSHSLDERVVVCPQVSSAASGSTAVLYFGEGGVTQRGTVCTYPRHGLTLTGSGPAARLERYDRSEALAMTSAGPDCPAPHAATSAQGYVETYDISTSTFLGIMHLWSAIASAPPADRGAGPGAAAGGKQAACAAASASRQCSSGSGGRSAPAAETHARLQAALGTRSSGATVTRIVRIPGSVIRHRYALFVTAPDASGGAGSQYVIYVDKSLRGPYELTAFAETN
jgi:hypothetical protein